MLVFSPEDIAMIESLARVSYDTAKEYFDRGFCIHWIPNNIPRDTMFTIIKNKNIVFRFAVKYAIKNNDVEILEYILKNIGEFEEDEDLTGWWNVDRIFDEICKNGSVSMLSMYINICGWPLEASYIYVKRKFLPLFFNSGNNFAIASLINTNDESIIREVINKYIDREFLESLDYTIDSFVSSHMRVTNFAKLLGEFFNKVKLTKADITDNMLYWIEHFGYNILDYMENMENTENMEK